MLAKKNKKHKKLRGGPNKPATQINQGGPNKPATLINPGGPNKPATVINPSGPNIPATLINPGGPNKPITTTTPPAKIAGETPTTTTLTATKSCRFFCPACATAKPIHCNIACSTVCD
ncbi:hypothetical protein F8M41_009149 [Gigaspora margarita]|uniref:Uncharacterized protein n=1 Tax=Gigaspora margarita TaxID=4874 RepID=A0A8H4AV96_GIGMA|nr:hypothetical protein F8M41_009149 [Gigaspora margarita]